MDFRRALLTIREDWRFWLIWVSVLIMAVGGLYFGVPFAVFVFENASEFWLS